MLSTEVLPLLLIRLALGSGGSVLEPANTGFIRHGESFSQLLTEATPIGPRCYQNLSMKTHNRWRLPKKQKFPYSLPTKQKEGT